MILPKEVELIMKKLNNGGFDAFVVGGACRDYIMGNNPHDYDLTTSATPENIKKIFDDDYFSVIPTGEKFGTITVFSRKSRTSYEITTFRKDIYFDGVSGDGRRPDEVDYSTKIEDDLSRRDFTINAIAYSKERGFVDPYRGIDDIKNGTIRCVGKPEERLKEDALRILRAIRFAVRYNFEIEENLREYIDNHFSDLERVSKERINTEIVKILSYSGCEYIFNHIIPNFRKKLFGDSVLIYYNKYTITLSNLFFNNKIDKFETWMKKYKFSNDDIYEVKKFLCIRKIFDGGYFNNSFEENVYKMKKIINLYGEESVKIVLSEWLKIDDFDKIIEIAESEPHSIKDLAIGGGDLIKIGIFERKIGKCLNYLLDIVSKNKLMNDTSILLKIATTWNNDNS